ncbi:hypothetical protein L7F22_048508 [Adiantum nelumboides]|nr:hypothetical protein [Adiantum nelumboides]
MQQGSIGLAVVAALVLNVPFGICQGVIYTLYSELFPTRVRYTAQHPGPGVLPGVRCARRDRRDRGPAGDLGGTLAEDVTGRPRSRRDPADGGSPGCRHRRRSGIGRAPSATGLCAAGASVARLDIDGDAPRSAAAAHRVRRPRRGRGGAGVRPAARELGGIDGLVTCAGVTDGTPTGETTLATWETVVGVNLTGTFLAVRAAAGHLVRRAGAPSSPSARSRRWWRRAVGGLRRVERGVLALTRSIATEYADRGVRANCVCPGPVGTGLARNSTRALGLARDSRTGVPGRVSPPQARTADPREVADVVVFLLSDAAAFVTGAAVRSTAGTPRYDRPPPITSGATVRAYG